MENQARVVFIDGNRLNLCLLTKGDADQFVHWMNDGEVAQFLSRHRPITPEQEVEYFEKLYKDDRNIILGIETKEGELIGSRGLHRIDYIDRIAMTGAVIGNKSFWNKGYGTEAKMLFLNYAFNVLNLRKICSEVFSFNGRSEKYSIGCGYHEEGRLMKHHFHNGEYCDVIQLAIFREDWTPIWEKYKKEHNL